MLKQTLVLGLLTLSGLYSAHAQEVLTLEKALNTAFEHSPSLIQSKLSLEQRQLNLKAQDASLKSQFSLDVTPFRYTRNNQYDNFNSKWYANETKMSSASFGITQPIKWTDGTISLYNDFSWQDASNRTSGGNNTSFNHNLSLRISQPLFTYNRTKMQLKELEYALENAKISYALQQLSIEKNVTSQFYDVYQKQKDLNISRDEYNNQKQNYDIIKNKVEAGLLAKEELYQAEVNLANSESTIRKRSVLKMRKTISSFYWECRWMKISRYCSTIIFRQSMSILTMQLNTPWINAWKSAKNRLPWNRMYFRLSGQKQKANSKVI